MAGIQLKSLYRGKKPDPGKGLIAIVCVLRFYSLLISIVCPFLNLDPFHFIYSDYCPLKIQNYPWASTICLVVRLILSYLCCSIFARMSSFTLVFVVVLIRLYNDLIAALRALHRRGGKMTNILRAYNRLQIILRSEEEGLQLATFTCASTGLILSVVSNFGTIKLYNVVPLMVYTFFPVDSINALGMSSVCLPPTIQIHEESFKVIHELQTDVKAWERKVVRRRLKALLPLRIHGGVFNHRMFKVTKSFKGGYYYSIVNYTITMLLAVPIHKLS